MQEILSQWWGLNLYYFKSLFGLHPTHLALSWPYRFTAIFAINLGQSLGLTAMKHYTSQIGWITMSVCHGIL